MPTLHVTSDNRVRPMPARSCDTRIFWTLGGQPGSSSRAPTIRLLGIVKSLAKKDKMTMAKGRAWRDDGKRKDKFAPLGA